MLLCRIQLSFGLRVEHLLIVYLLACNGTLREERLAAFESFGCGVELLFGGFDVGGGFDDGFGNGGQRGGAVVGFGLVDLAFVGGGGGLEVAILEDGEKLA